MPVTPSPGFALLTGTNYLRRTTNDAIYATNGTDELSVAMVLDPELVWTSGQDGTLVSKFRSDNDQRQFRVTYSATTGLFTVGLWLLATDVAAAATRVNTIAIRRRAVIAFTYDGSGPTLNLYVNGALDNGTLTGTVPAVLPVSTEPVAVGAENTSGTASNVWRGAVYLFALWNKVLTGGEVATILRDGLVPAPLEAGGYAPQYICEHNQVVQVANSTLFLRWDDLSGSGWDLLPAAASGAVPFAQQDIGGRLIVSNQWDSSLTDVGFRNEGLTSTYTNAPPWRLWGAPLDPPRRVAYRDDRHDWTIFLRARRVAGTAETLFIQYHGVELRYNFASKELFAIVGTDTTLTLLNTRISFGVNIFPVEGIPADIILRYNALNDDVDVWIGVVTYGKTLATTNSFFNGTDLTLTDESDFSFAVVVPRALTDAQIEQLRLLNLQQAVGSVVERFLQVVTPGYAPTPLNTPDADAVAADPADPAAASIPIDVSGLRSPLLGMLPVPGFTFSPYLPVEVGKRIYFDPLPVAISVVANITHDITATAQAGPTDAYPCLVWWEVELELGGDCTAVSPRFMTTAFFVQRVTDIRIFTVPVGQTWNGKRIRYVVQAAQDATQMWVSNWLTMLGANFDNGGNFQIPIYGNPLPAVLSVSVDSAHLVTVTGELGPVTSNIIGFPPIDYWWEVGFAVDFVAVVDLKPIVSVPLRVGVADTFLVPLGMDLNGRILRLGARARYDTAQVWYSPSVALSDPNFNNTGISPLPSPPSGGALGTVQRDAPPRPGPGVWVERRTDLSSTRRRL